MKRISGITCVILLCTMCSAGSEWQDVIDNDYTNPGWNNEADSDDKDEDDETAPLTYEVKIGVFTDAHYSATKTNTTERFYSASKQKISEAVQTFNGAEVDLIISLGDLVDNDYTDYSDIDKELAKLSGPIYKVLGNHDFITPFSEQLQEAALKDLGITNRYFSITVNGIRLIFLDSSDIATYSHPLESKGYREAEAIYKTLKDDLAPNARTYNGAVGSVQMEWLKEELTQAQSLSQPVVCLIHIPLALPAAGNKYTLWNDEDMLDLIAEYTCVKAVIGGHHHQGGYVFKDNIHHITLKGMVQGEQNSYSVVVIKKDGIKIDGYGRETDNEYKIK